MELILHEIIKSIANTYGDKFFTALVNNSVQHGFNSIEQLEKGLNKITISLSKQGDDFIVDYQDNGQGIDVAVQSKVFEPRNAPQEIAV